jgi:hypothetical protein
MKTNQSFYKPGKLFSVDTNPKTVKGQKYGFKTCVLYLAPAKLSGFQVCPMAEIAGCIEPCLNTAGNPAYAESKAKGRLNKTLYFFNARDDFMRQMAREIALESGKATLQGYTLLVRPNGTSDIKWEKVDFILDEKTARKIGKVPGHYQNIMQLFPEIQFYDYTKIANRHGLPANYDLTFSYSGLPRYQPFVQKAIAQGLRVAVVFRDKKKIPTRFLGLQCVNGDDSDIRHLDPAGCIVALYAKGKAKKDMSGFVVDNVHPVIQLKVA